jgi:hypothetical protein
MVRRRIAAIAVLALLGAPAAAGAETVSQTVKGVIDATNVHLRSTLLRVVPVVSGVSWFVRDLNDEIELINHSDKVVTAFGYSGEPYLKILPSGSVELNENSPAYYLNQSFFAAGVTVPAHATSTATPDWVTVAKTGTFLWHDHRIHLYYPGVPRQVTNLDRTTFIQSWTVPIEVGTTKGALYGKLVWIGEKPFAFPTGAIIAFVILVLASVVLVVVVRRRRATGGAGGHSSQEAW